MIQIRDVLQVKFGDIDQAVELFTKEGSPGFPFSNPEFQFNVLTDISGPMYTLINEFIAPDLAHFEKIRDQSYTQPGFEEWFRQFQLFVQGGRREYYTIEGKYQPWSTPGKIVVRETYNSYKWQIRMAVSLLERYGALLADRGVGQRPRILTDASGPMFRAIIELETDSMATWETQRRQVFLQPEFKVWFIQLLTAVEGGQHDFYRVEYTSSQPTVDG